MQNQNKIIIGLLIFILIAAIGMVTYFVATKKSAELKIAEKKLEEKEDEDERDPELSMAEHEIFEEPRMGDDVAIMKIKDYGTIKIKFFRDVAPKAVENFIGLSEKGYYNGVTFHRVINDFMIQGGDPTGTGSGGESFFGTDFGPEYKDGYFPYRGTLCMASAPGIENSLSSQFFIVQAKANPAAEEMIRDLPRSIQRLYQERGGTPHLYKQHTVFGYVYEGMNIVDKIAATKTNDNDKPLKDVIIEKITIQTIEDK